MWLAWRRVAGVISRIRRGVKAASLRPRGAPHSALKITLPIITTMAHGMQCNSCRASEHEDTTTYTSGEFKEREGKRAGASEWIWFYFFSSNLWSAHISQRTLASRVVQTFCTCISRICFIGLPVFLPLISHLSSSLSLSYTEMTGLSDCRKWFGFEVELEPVEQSRVLINMRRG